MKKWAYNLQSHARSQASKAWQSQSRANLSQSRAAAMAPTFKVYTRKDSLAFFSRISDILECSCVLLLILYFQFITRASKDVPFEIPEGYHRLPPSFHYILLFTVHSLSLPNVNMHSALHINQF